MIFNQNSLSRRLLKHFLLIGGSVFSLIAAILYLFSINFANLAVEQSMFGMAEDIQTNLAFDGQSQLTYQSTQVAERWGYDALYNNLGFRVIDLSTQQELLRSFVNPSVATIIDTLPTSLPEGYSQIAARNNTHTDLFRIIFIADERRLALDLARNDLLGELANEAVMPVLSQVAALTIGAAFLVFVCVTFISIRALVRPVENVTTQLLQIKPNQLDRRLSTTDVPAEILPLVLGLNEAMERVEQGFEEQKRFVANAAHELRTPLAILSTRVELTEIPPEVEPALMGDIKYMSRVIEQLLDLSRAQNQVGFTHSLVDLKDIGKDVCMLLGPLSVTHQKELSLDVIDPSCDVLGDKGALIILTKNLLENALKYAEKHAHVQLIITKNALSIKDSGPGISEGDRVKLFERFWRKEQSALTGSGLGLSIVSEIANAHNADIDVICNNDLGGATFTITFNATP
ncbi:two-component sensor histidine kinase [Pseudoalteromonas sp. MSK9-3]|uniref:sensor histidine kinase n=1 Tax=Pseudoalteromonas sp. MSK9-3 TaxID=1897633 RepID=UPI000E6C71AE|nr:HAMP domain-containing sensor histidine kinase [Pseudoalteromonas sp. MSK9-3]RJE77551.1 two-component sensor histidine kinase [Pseudoalteromonas sp. MSK9-3]